MHRDKKEWENEVISRGKTETGIETLRTGNKGTLNEP